MHMHSLIIYDGIHTGMFLCLYILHNVVLIAPGKEHQTFVLYPLYQVQVLQEGGGVRHYTLQARKIANVYYK